MTVTVTDLFCGAGGSSLGARHVVERDTGPTAGLAQDSLFSDGGAT